MKRFVEVGQRVKAGAVLATLDDTDLKLQKEQADAEFAASQRGAEAGRRRGSARRKAQEGRLDRAGGARPRTRCGAGGARPQPAGRPGRGTRREQPRLRVLRADADGVVTATSIEPGQVVAVGRGRRSASPARAKWKRSVALPETYVGAAGAGEARLFLWSNPGKTYRAKLRELSPSADPATRNFAARFSILDADAAISLGMSATLADRQSGRDPPSISVPLSALYNQGQGPALWKVDADGKLLHQPVNVAALRSQYGDRVGRVKEGENIVILGVAEARSGQKVRVIAQNSILRRRRHAGVQSLRMGGQPAAAGSVPDAGHRRRRT